MEAVSTILKVAQQIAKAAETARRNRARCRDLADRARTLGGILRDHYSSSTSTKAGGGGDTAARRSALGRLKAALDDALRLVESCRRRSGWLSCLTAGRTAARFQEIESRINTCVGDLGIANDARLEKLLNDLSGSGKKEANRGNGKIKDAVAKNSDRSGGGASSGGAAAAAASGFWPPSLSFACRRLADAVAKNSDRSGGGASSGGAAAAAASGFWPPSLSFACRRLASPRHPPPPSARWRQANDREGGAAFPIVCLPPPYVSPPSSSSFFELPEAAAAAAPAPPQLYGMYTMVYTMEEEPAACSVM